MANKSNVYQHLTVTREDEEYQALRFDAHMELSDAKTREQLSAWITKIKTACTGIGEVGAKFLAMRVVDHVSSNDEKRAAARIYGEQLQQISRSYALE